MNKLIAEFMGLVYIPWNDLQGYAKPGWWKKPTQFKKDSGFTKVIKQTQMGHGNPKITKNFYMGRDFRGLGYDTWNIMKVVEKIENTDCSEFSYSWEQGGETYYNYTYPTVEIFHEYCDVYFEMELDPPMWISSKREKSESKHEAIYNSIIEFINWYNERKNEIFKLN